MPDRLPPLLSLTAFEAAARRGSFAEAGRELHLSASAVSHRVRVLERHLGRSLFERLPRSLRLTDHGNAYLPVVQDALDGLLRGTEGVFGVVPRAADVTVRAPISYSSLVLAPQLDRLQRETGLRVQVVSSIWGPGGVDVEADLSVEFEIGEAEPIGPSVTAMALSHPATTSGQGRVLGRVDVMGFEELWTDLALVDGEPRVSSLPAALVDTWVGAVHAVAATPGWCALVPDVIARQPLDVGLVAEAGARVPMRQRFGLRRRNAPSSATSAAASVAAWITELHQST